jgi:ATP-binding cassette subfamily B multidrug efflux pump
VEEGDHQSLLALDGLYARLWAHQSGGFLGDALDESEVRGIERSVQKSLVN